MRGGWEREADEARARRLPSVEDLPRSGDGYDRAAVEAAFESFYRHAAEVDRTLEVLEAVAAFQREAGSLRADIRSLRAASWGPVPTLRHTVATTAAAARADRGGAAFSAWPRIALYSAFIILVGVGAALADMTSGAIVLVVLAAWAIVGLAELAVSGFSGRAQPLPHGYPAWAAEPAVEDEAEAIAEVEEIEEVEEPEPMVEAAVEPEVEAVEPAAEEESEERPAWRPWRRPEPEVAELAEPPSHVHVLPVVDEAAEEQALEEPEPVVEAAAQEAAVEEVVHDEAEPEVEALEAEAAEPDAEARPEEEPALEAVPDEPEAALEPEAEGETEPEAETEAEPVAEAEPAPEAYETPLPPERQPRLRFWRRRPQPPPLDEPEPSEPRHVRIIDVEPATDEDVDVPWEGEQPAAEAEEPLDAWERAEVPPEPLFGLEPPHDEPELEPEAQPPGPEPEPEAQAEPEPEPATAMVDDEQTEEPLQQAERRPVFTRRGRR